MKRFTITISGEGDTKEAREAAQDFVKHLESQKIQGGKDKGKPVHTVKQAIFNCDNPEDQLDLLHERYASQRAKELEEKNLDERGALKK